MSPVLFLLLLFLRTAELRHVRAARDLELEDAGAGTEASPSTERTPPSRLQSPRAPDPRRVARGARDRGSWRRDPHTPGAHGHPRRHDDPSGYFTTPGTRPGNSSAGPLNPLFPVTDGSYWAYAVMLLALALFAAGVVGNLALMCIVWHSFYLKSAWNCILAGLALWDFLVLVFCLPVVVFHELTARRLLGQLACRLVPYLEVSGGTLGDRRKRDKILFNLAGSSWYIF